MDDNCKKFVTLLCALSDGENYVPESEIRKRWPECPPRSALLNLGNGTYFEWNIDLNAPGFVPTAQGRRLIENLEYETDVRSVLHNLNDRFEHEHQERLNSDRKNARHQWINTLCVVISLVLALWPYLARAIDLIRSVAE